MYLRLWSGDDPYLSYRIYKNPNGEDYTRQFGKRTVLGKYSIDNNDNLVYNVIVDNDYKQFIDHHKQLNSFSYLHHTLNSVTNYTLYLISEVFRSALKEQFPQEISEYYMDYHSYSIMVGPFCTDVNEFFFELCLDIGLRAYCSMSEDGYSYNLHFETEGMQFNKFLQKVFIVTYCLVSNIEDMSVLHKDAVEKLKSFTDSWINDFSDDSYKNWIIKRLSGYKTTFAKIFMEEEAVVVKEVFESAHEKRHKIIVDITKDYNSFIDVGCGTGELSYLLIAEDKSRTVLGIDSDDWRIRKARKNKSVKRNNKQLANAYYGGLSFYNTNALYPILHDYIPFQDCMVCSEFIEHLTLEDRKRFYELVLDYYKPRYLVITTPNYEYNVNYPGLVNEDGTISYRHKDHKIEFTKVELLQELKKYLGYSSYTEHHLYSETNPLEPISFIFKFEFKVHSKALSEWNMTLNSQFPNKREQLIVNNGLCSNHFNPNIFYLGETISPVDGDDNEVESIDKALELVDDPIVEIKEMGSRAYILWFNSLDNAKAHGYSEKIIVHSRNGYDFFSDDEDIKFNIWKEINQAIGTSCASAIFDSEITPWKYKASELIDKQFHAPISCALADYGNKYYITNDGRYLSLYNDAKRASETLALFTKDEPVQVHVFDIIMLNDMPQHQVKSVKNNMLDYWFKDSNIIKPIKWSDNPDKIYRYGLLRHKEGFIVRDNKDSNKIFKVRDNKTLRLIYGLHYNADDFKFKNTSKKRGLSKQQIQAKKNIVLNFNNKVKRILWIGYFLGLDKYNIDRTM